LWDHAREDRDFSKVDTMKAALLNAGVEVRMSKDGVKLLSGASFDPTKLAGL
jgi:cysteinyl-tRNA synthetase